MASEATGPLQKRWAVYVPDAGFEFQPSRSAAIKEARRILANADGGEGWSDDMTSLGVYFGWAEKGDEAGEVDWRPLVTAREQLSSKRWKRDCPTDTDNHDCCDVCEGSAFVDQHGEPWSGDPDWQYIVSYEFPPIKTLVQRVLGRFAA